MGGIERRIRRLTGRAGVFRSSDLKAAGVPRSYLQRLCRRGVLDHVGRGLYRFADAPLTEHHSLVEAAKLAPSGVICLLSALQFHGLGTQAPFEVWLALDRPARHPRAHRPPLRIVRMSGGAQTAGVERHRIEGVTLKVYGAAKTVADCFKFRNKIGLDVALEALREFRRMHRGQVDEVWRFAKICRVAAVMRPYFEALP